MVVCFVPSDAMLGAALAARPGLHESALRQRVVLVGPGALLALLRTVAFTWQQDALSDSARELLDLGRELHSRLGTLGAHTAKLGRSLQSSVEAYNAMVGALESRVLVTARRMRDLDVVTDDLGVLEPVRSGPRPLTAQELIDAVTADDSRAELVLDVDVSTPPTRGARSDERGAASGLTAAGIGAALVVGAGVVAARQPPRLARVLSRQQRVLFQVRTPAREVALTFDDGPHPTLTRGILDVLARHDAGATFFLLGARVEEHPEAVRALVAAGHEVGNHGWVDEPAVLQPVARYRQALERTSAAVAAATGGRPTLTRPGSGLVRPAQVREAAALGMRTVLGSVAVPDAEVRDVEVAARFVLDRVQPGAVIVLHEGLAQRHRVVDLLERLLPELARRGYRSVTVSDLLAGGRPFTDCSEVDLVVAGGGATPPFRGPETPALVEGPGLDVVLARREVQVVGAPRTGPLQRGARSRARPSPGRRLDGSTQSSAR